MRTMNNTVSPHLRQYGPTMKELNDMTAQIMRRTLVAGALSLSLLGLAACSTDPTGATTTPTTTQSEQPSDGGGQEQAAERYEITGALSPVRLSATSPEGEDVEIQLLGMADVKPKGETDTAWLPVRTYEQAQDQLETITKGAEVELIADPAAEDTTDDGALLRYVRIVEGGDLVFGSPGTDEDGDVGLELIAWRLGAGDNDDSLSDLEMYDRYVEATLDSLNPGSTGNGSEFIAPNDDWSDYTYSS